MLYHNFKKNHSTHTETVKTVPQSPLNILLSIREWCVLSPSFLWLSVFCILRRNLWGEKSNLQEIPPETNFTCQVTQSPCCADQPACLPLCCSLNVASGPISGWKVTLTRGVEEILLTYECTLTKGQQGNTGNEGALDVAFSFCEVALEHVRSPIMRIGHSKANRQI